MSSQCNEVLTYRKAIPSEIIIPGDVIMIDPNTGMIKRTEINDFNDYIINSRLIVGICIASDNSSALPEILDGGSAEDVERESIDGGTSDYSDENIQIILIEGGLSDQNSREIIKVEYGGTCLVNISGYVDIGDELCISSEPGKAKSKDYLNKEYFYSRSIGKVIKYTNNPNQVKVLLDIE